MDRFQQDEILQNVNSTLENVIRMDEKLDQLLDLSDAMKLSTLRHVGTASTAALNTVLVTPQLEGLHRLFHLHARPI